MARSNAVWGIDIGQCSLKALRCHIGETPDTIVADAFDYIAYPKILSQPGADPVELIQEALKLFLSRNTVKGDRVVISVPGQKGLVRSPPLPPVEAKKIHDLVKYEAKQQIPFDLDEVVWDYQRMSGGSEAEGFVLETEITLVAMKRDEALRAIEPFKQAGIEVDYVQLTPLVLYNYLLFDQLTNLPPAEEYMPDDPPPSSLILSLGTDATDLVVTDGFRIKQRSIPLGGNHFTKALTKDLKLTFAKAEHLKCHVAKAKDPKRLFQAMRPVFNDLLTEIQRSIDNWTSTNRYMRIERAFGVGNAMKMPGLRRYLAQNLDMEVIRVDQFNHLKGDEVLSNSAFRRNTPSFGICYGLVIQALGAGQGVLKTNLLPREIVKERFIREKKPWTVAALAMILLGCTIGYTGRALALKGVSDTQFKKQVTQAESVAREAQSFASQEEEKKTQFGSIDQVGQHLIGNVDNRVLWLEMLRAVSECFPRYGDGEKRPDILKYHERKELILDSLECQKVDDLSVWYQDAKQWMDIPKTPPGDPNNPNQGMPMDGSRMPMDGGMPGEGGMQTGTLGDATTGPSGPGWIIQLKGRHYYYNDPTKWAKTNSAGNYVKNTLIKNIREHKVRLSVIQQGVKDPNEKPKEISLEELGVGYPILIDPPSPTEETMLDPNDNKGGMAATGTPRGPRRGAFGIRAPGEIATARPVGAEEKKEHKFWRFDFTVQFVWIPTPPSERLERQKEKEAKEKAAAEAAAENNPM